MAWTALGINDSQRKRGTLEREDTELQGCNMIKESPFETVQELYEIYYCKIGLNNMACELYFKSLQQEIVWIFSYSTM